MFRALWGLGFRALAQEDQNFCCVSKLALTFGPCLGVATDSCQLVYTQRPRSSSLCVALS